MSYIRKKDGFLGQKAIIIPSKILASVCMQHPVVKELYVTDIGYYPNAKYHHRHRPGGSKAHILIYCVKGSGKVIIEKQSFSISPGDFVLLPARKAHEYYADENNPWTIYWIHFSGDNSQNFLKMMMRKMGAPVLSISFREKRLRLFEEIYSNLEKGYSTDNIGYANLCLQYFLASCCFDNNFDSESRKEKTDTIELCIQYMQKNIDRPLMLREIATIANLSISHLTGLFKKKTGFSLIEYFNHLKTQKACQYLLFTNLRVNEIASKLGIDDPYYFTRMFTKIIGVSPAKYRSKRGE